MRSRPAWCPQPERAPARLDELPEQDWTPAGRAILRSEMTILGSQGYPTEIFEVTTEIVAHRERFARLISHTLPFSEVGHAFDLTLTPGAAEKVVVTFDDQP
ncbi:hypothetical protein AB0L65_17520 [Nonomuraea sp. NPDC052116]|uniref:hypothetical protein n=1 Tax=Nonomuraea sp. NPDC052116 TaxID=3155665 RepID=UPI003422F2B1